MKNRTIFILLGIIIFIVLIIVSVIMMNKGEEYSLYEVSESDGIKTELIGLTETEDEAKEVAFQYGIEFVSFDSGVAVYETEEDAQAVIARGKEKGYTPLSINRSVMIDD